MTREELLGQEKRLGEEKAVALRNSAEQVLDLVQKVADKGFKVSMGWVSDYSIEFNFDRGDKDNFGLDFRVYWNNSLKTIELSHSCGLSADSEYMRAIKPYIVQRDKIIARLWEHEATLEHWFKTASELSKLYDAKIADIQGEIRNLDYQEQKNIVDKLKVGTKICFKPQYDVNRTATISKVAYKNIYFAGGYYGMQSKSYIVNKILKGDWIIAE